MSKEEDDITKEIERFWGDVKMSEGVLLSEKEKYATSLKNGVGDDFINHLDNPPPSKRRIFHDYFKNLFKNLFKKKSRV